MSGWWWDFKNKVWWHLKGKRIAAQVERDGGFN